jgi:hypothetical protein
MSYVVKETKTYNQAAAEVIKSAETAINQLGGKPSKKNKPAEGRLEANFNKKVGGKPINNRVQLEVKIASQSAEQSSVSIEAYPVDPMGNKLAFGVRGQPGRVVIDAFLSALAG